MADAKNGSGLAPRWERRAHRVLRPVLQAAIAAGDEHVGEDGIAYGIGPRGAALGVGIGLAFAGLEVGADLAEAATADLMSQKGRELVRYRRAQAERRASEAQAAQRAEQPQSEQQPAQAAPRDELAEVRAQLAALAEVVSRILPQARPVTVPDEMLTAATSSHAKTGT